MKALPRSVIVDKVLIDVEVAKDVRKAITNPFAGAGPGAKPVCVGVDVQVGLRPMICTSFSSRSIYLS